MQTTAERATCAVVVMCDLKAGVTEAVEGAHRVLARAVSTGLPHTLVDVWTKT